MAFEQDNVMGAADAVVVIGGREVDMVEGIEVEIPLSHLFLSMQNVRKVRNPQTIPELAATIEAQGLLSRLAVIPEKVKGVKVKGQTFGVVAGGRRLAALQWLVEQGRKKADELVKCLQFTPDRAVAVSLTENTQQEAMHPADQLEAFKKLVDQGKDVGQIAAAFGVSALTVERRLKLASLAPEFLAMFRKGEIKLDQLQALAAAGDSARQLEVWKALPEWNRSAYHITEMLTAEEVKSSAPLAVFVGLDAYRAAGGPVREDLFAQDGIVFLQDAVLLNTLAVAKLNEAAEPYRAAGWKWVEARLSFDYSERSHFGRQYAEAGKPTEKEQAALDEVEAQQKAIQARIDALEADDEGDGREWTDEEAAEHSSLEDQLEGLEALQQAMEDALTVWAPEQHAKGGVVVHLTRNGVEVMEGLISPDDRKQVEQEARAAGEAAPEFDRPAPKDRADLSASLCQDLTAHRTAAVAAALTQAPHIALAALLHSLIMKDRAAWLASPLGIRFDDKSSDVAANASEHTDSQAAQDMERAAVVFDHLPGDSGKLFAHLQSMSVPDLLEILALYVARSYSVQSPEVARTYRHGAFDPAQGIEAALGLDMADWWAPTPARYLSRVPKSKMIEAVTEACDAEAAKPLEKMKEGEAVAAAAALLEGKRWLPATLRAYAHNPAEGNEA